jgi:hypothetical protein
MKRPFSAPSVTSAAAALVSAYLRFCYRTMRWVEHGREIAEADWAGGGGVMLCFWHSRVSLAPKCWPLDRAQEARALISLSRDGEFIAQTMERLGFPAIRGSKAKDTDRTKNKGGAAAFRDIVRWVRGGKMIAITPDGPRGPAEQMGDGPPMIARITGVPVLLAGFACKPAIHLKTWDRTVVPLPFSRAAIVWDGPLHAPSDADEETMKALSLEWADRLSAATRRAEAMVG